MKHFEIQDRQPETIRRHIGAARSYAKTELDISDYYGTIRRSISMCCSHVIF